MHRLLLICISVVVLASSTFSCRGGPGGVGRGGGRFGFNDGSRDGNPMMFFIPNQPAQGNQGTLPGTQQGSAMPTTGIAGLVDQDTFDSMLFRRKRETEHHASTIQEKDENNISEAGVSSKFKIQGEASSLKGTSNKNKDVKSVAATRINGGSRVELKGLKSTTGLKWHTNRSEGGLEKNVKGAAGAGFEVDAKSVKKGKEDEKSINGGFGFGFSGEKSSTWHTNRAEGKLEKNVKSTAGARFEVGENTSASEGVHEKSVKGTDVAGVMEDANLGKKGKEHEKIINGKFGGELEGNKNSAEKGHATIGGGALGVKVGANTTSEGGATPGKKEKGDEKSISSGIGVKLEGNKNSIEKGHTTIGGGALGVKVVAHTTSEGGATSGKKEKGDEKSIRGGIGVKLGGEIEGKSSTGRHHY